MDIYYPVCLAVSAIYDNLCVCTSNQILFLSYWCIELFFLLNPLFRWYKSINYSDVECYHSNGTKSAGLQCKWTIGAFVWYLLNEAGGNYIM